MDRSSRWKRLFDRLAEVRDLRAAAALMQWDQETMMPPLGIEGRARALATLAGLAHERFTDPSLGDDLDALGAHADGNTADEAAILREVRRDFHRSTKVPRDLVRALAEEESRAQESWQRARAARRFDAFAPHLRRLLELKRAYADAVGFAEVPLDALLEDHEPGTTTSFLEGLFVRLQSELAPLIAAARDSRRTVDVGPVRRRVPMEAQRAFARRVVESMGFDFDAGRIDRSAHPFCTGIHRGDTRLTFRGSDDDLRPLVFGLIHEAGHGLYEQGLVAGEAFSPLEEAVSLGVHESQSRLWENVIARSRPFWVHFLPVLQDLAPGAFDDVDVDAMFRAVNEVRPSFIRVEADELTYDLHVALRFFLERDLFSGALAVDDLPAAWNDRFEALLGIRPEHDADGALQDIHWSMGAFGYFPTYTLGNLFAAQLYEAAARELPGLEDGVARGELLPLREWLRARVHRLGRRHPPRELIRLATGAEPSVDPFLRHVRRKLEAIYGV